jgi:hypothetical protein
MPDKMLVLTTAIGTTVQEAVDAGQAQQQFIPLRSDIPELTINMAIPGSEHRLDVIASHDSTFSFLVLPGTGQEPAMLTFFGPVTVTSNRGETQLAWQNPVIS